MRGKLIGLLLAAVSCAPATAPATRADIVEAVLPIGPEAEFRYRDRIVTRAELDQILNELGRLANMMIRETGILHCGPPRPDPPYRVEFHVHPAAPYPTLAYAIAGAWKAKATEILVYKR